MKKIIVDCREDNKFEYGRSITRCCNSSFSLEKENVFYVETPGYFDDIIGQYYAICPNCGYIVLLNKENLPDNLKTDAEERNKQDPYQHMKNNLISQLIHLESKTQRANGKTRVRTFY